MWSYFAKTQAELVENVRCYACIRTAPEQLQMDGAGKMLELSLIWASRESTPALAYSTTTTTVAAVTASTLPAATKNG